MVTNLYVVAAVLAGSGLILMTWAWHRALPRSGDAIFLPPQLLLSVAILLGVLPRLFWPKADDVQISGSIASIILATVSVVMSIRRMRRVRRGRP
jgi:hypothetical protein